jgi:3D (Asp-Asp-Asp) domain-containing protein
MYKFEKWTVFIDLFFRELHIVVLIVIAVFMYKYHGNFKDVTTELHNLDNKLVALEGELQKPQHKIYSVTATMYHPVRSQTDATPNQLASGVYIKPSKASNYRFVALSRDLLTRWGGPFDYGDYIIIEGVNKSYDGIYQVQDTMNPSITKTVDILCTPGTPQFKEENVKLITI